MTEQTAFCCDDRHGGGSRGSERAGERGVGVGGAGEGWGERGGAIPAIASLMPAIVQCGRLHDDDTGDTVANCVTGGGSPP